MNWTYLSKHGQDEYINLFAKGSGAVPTTLETWNFDSDNNPLVLRGILKHKIIKRCWATNRKFLYMDTGYFGNQPNQFNPHGWKVWHRIVPNNFQHDEIIPRPSDRWESHKIKLLPRKHGSKILIAAPDEKPCQVYGIELQKWIDDIVKELKNLTDREVVIRSRDPNRQKRLSNSFQQAMEDVHAVVTFNSNAATEAIMFGVPAFVLAPCSAARPVANTDLTKINDPFFPDHDLRHSWCCHLAYGQFHNTELENGIAKTILEKEFP